MFVAAAAYLFSACNTKEKVDCSTFHWGYSYTNGPDLWGQCEAECKGKQQSPIALVDADAESDGSLAALQTNYHPTPIDVEHNGHAIELVYEAGSTITWEGENYELKQAHLHGGSEHTLNGEQYDLEIHLVHKNEAGSSAVVVGIFIEEGTENAFFNQFFGNLPKIEGEHFTDTTEVNIADMFPAASNYYTYSGSLTTPPCSEIVTWIVMKEPVTASAAQIETLRAILPVTYRPTQKLNGRTVRKF